MKTLLIFPMLFFCFVLLGRTQSILVEAESFENKGTWLVDPQFVEQMGSPYLLAHGIGKPVKDACTKILIKKEGLYHVWARTKNWMPGNWKAPGRFDILVNGVRLGNELGLTEDWNWEYAGKINLQEGSADVALHDLTGFDGRCDALFFSLNKDVKFPQEKADQLKWRARYAMLSVKPDQQKTYDLVVVGGGIAGCAASIAAAEQGLKVALVHDRPVLGGNASGEIRVHTLGIYGSFERILKMLDTEHYPNGSSDALKEDQKRQQNMAKYPNIDIYLNYRAFNATEKKGRVISVDARHTHSADFIRFSAPLFVDCTGDGWIGYWSGAEYQYGRDAVSRYNESWEKHGSLWCPESPDNFVMGSSLLWGSEKLDHAVDFPEVPWALEVAKNYAAANGEWQWEFSKNELSQIEDAETIRDHMLCAIYGSFYNYRKQNNANELNLKWVSYLLGKRESRRLTGDYIFTLNDAREKRSFPDAVVFETREVDVHYQQNLLDASKPDFLSEAMFYKTDMYQIPYRCLYSKNIKNLFMAGRNFSCSHVGLGGPRVMRTTGQMGVAVGLAASLCKKYNAGPREIYQSHLEEYLKLIQSQK